MSHEVCKYPGDIANKKRRLTCLKCSCCTNPLIAMLVYLGEACLKSKNAIITNKLHSMAISILNITTSGGFGFQLQRLLYCERSGWFITNVYRISVMPWVLFCALTATLETLFKSVPSRNIEKAIVYRGCQGRVSLSNCQERPSTLLHASRSRVPSWQR